MVPWDSPRPGALFEVTTSTHVWAHRLAYLEISLPLFMASDIEGKYLSGTFDGGVACFCL